MINRFFDKLGENSNKEFLLKEENTYTYGHLLEAVEDVRCYLKKVGVVPGDYIPILIENFPEYLVALLAVFAVGACAAPIAIDMTDSEIKEVIRNVKPRTILTTVDYAHRVKDFLVKIIEFNWKKKLVNAEHQVTTDSMDISGNGRALLLFSSGTNSKPKGVIRSYKAVLTQMLVLSRTFSFKANDVVLCTARPQHSYGLENVLAALYGGATICFLNAFDYNKIKERLKDEGCTVFVGVPFIYDILTKASKTQKFNTRLRLALSAGAPLSEETNIYFEKIFGIPVTQIYGSSEAPSSTANLAVGSNKKYVSVGKPFPGVEIKILDEAQQVLPPNSIGELWVKSPFTSECYYHQPNLTKRHFVNGWVRTGDLGYLTEEGLLYLQGKIKNMINVAGNKVNPVEVEMIVSRFQGVKEVIVSGVPDAVYGEKVKATVVCAEGTSPKDVELLKFCQGKLADYKVPRIIEYVSSLNRTATGKLKR